MRPCGRRDPHGGGSLRRFLYTYAGNSLADTQGVYSNGLNSAYLAAVPRADVYRHHADCHTSDHFSPSKAATEVMVRPRRGESARISTIAAARTIPVVDPMQCEAARATFRSRLFHRRRSPLLSATVKMQGSNERTRHRSHPMTLGVCVRSYVSMRVPAWQPQQTKS